MKITVEPYLSQSPSQNQLPSYSSQILYHGDVEHLAEDDFDEFTLDDLLHDVRLEGLKL